MSSGSIRCRCSSLKKIASNHKKPRPPLICAFKNLCMFWSTHHSFFASRYYILPFNLWFSAIKSSSTDLSKGWFLGLPVLSLPRCFSIRPAAPSSKLMRSHLIIVAYNHLLPLFFSFSNTCGLFPGNLNDFRAYPL